MRRESPPLSPVVITVDGGIVDRNQSKGEEVEKGSDLERGNELSTDSAFGNKFVRGYRNPPVDLHLGSSGH